MPTGLRVGSSIGLVGIVAGGGCGCANEKCEGSCAAAYICAGVILGGWFEPSTGLIGLVTWCIEAMVCGGSIGLIGLVIAGPVNEKWEGSWAAANSCTGVVLRGGPSSVGLTGLRTGGPENE